MPLDKAAAEVADTEDLGGEALTIIQLVAVAEAFVAAAGHPIVTTPQVVEVAGFAGLEATGPAMAAAVAAALAEPVAKAVSLVRQKKPGFAVAAVVAGLEAAMDRVMVEAA